MRTSSAKAKGRNLQKHVVEVITRIFGLEEGDVESRPMGSAGVDCMMSPRARREVRISVECKNTKTFPSISALSQSDANKYDSTIAAVVWKPPRQPFSKSIIYFDLETFMQWLKEIKE